MIVRKRQTHAIVLGIITAIAAINAPAAQSDDLSICRNPDLQLAPLACSQLIDQLQTEGEGAAHDLVLLLTARAKALHRSHEYTRAAVDTDWAIKITPQDAELRLLRGNIAYEAKDYAGAISHYSRAIERDPLLARAYAGRGGARTYEGDLEGALTDFEEAIGNGFATAWTYNGRGNAFRAAGDLDRAYEDYLYAAALDPSKVDAWLNIGDVRLIRGDNEGAFKAYQRAVELDPEDQTDAVTGATGLGEALARLGQHDEALAAYERGFARATQGEITAGQQYLADMGHYAGPIDGVYTSRTRTALEACITDSVC